MEERIIAAARYGSHGILKLLVGETSAGFLIIGVVEQAKHVVEVLLTLGGLGNTQVEVSANQVAFRVIADLGIVRILVGPVVLNPGIKAGFGSRLDAVAGRVFNFRDGITQLAQVLFTREHSGALIDLFGVVFGHALAHPQHVGVVLLVVVERPQGYRPNALHIPKVKILMRHQAQKRLVASLGAIGGAAHFQGGREEVFEAAAAALQVMHDEEVMVERVLAHHAVSLLAHFFQVGHQFGLVHGVSAVHGHLVRRAVGREFQNLLVADFNGRVGQLVVAGGFVVEFSRRGAERRTHLRPAGSWLHGHGTAQHLVIGRIHEHAAAVEVAVVSINK